MDILSGGVCPYCGIHMDYGKFGWVIEKYEKGKAENLYKRIVFLFIAIYIGAIAIGAIAAGSTEDGKEMLSASGYAEFLRSENMTEEETGNSAFCFYRAASYGGEDGYVKVVIEPAEDGMTVTFSMTDEIGE